MNAKVIQASGLSKRYERGATESSGLLRDKLARAMRSPWKAWSGKKLETFWALKDVSLEVGEGEVLGLIGRNGSGKTTLLKILSRITRPTSGIAELHGRVGSLLEVGTGFHPELTGRENTYLSGAILGMSKQEIARKFDEIVTFAELEKFIDTPVKHYSSGMYVRLAFAVAAHLEPEILLVDEVLAVGDINFQRKCLGRMSDVARAGRTIILVSHQLNQIRRLCHRVAWLEGGALVQTGTSTEVVSAYESKMTSAEGGARLDGSGRAAFLRWHLGVTGQQAPHVLTTDGETQVSFVVQVNKELRGIHHGIALYDSSRQLIWGNSVDGLNLGTGEYELRHEISTLPLRPGSYSWRVSLYDGGEMVDDWEALPPMSVATVPLAHKNDEWAGILNVASTCRVREVRATHE